jgi:hypothetical protein
MSKIVHTFRQSWLKTAAICPERARRELDGTMPHRETDAAAVGTAVHAGIEAHLEGLAPEYADALEVAQNTFAEIEQHPDFIWAKYSHNTAQSLIDTFLAQWWPYAGNFVPLETEKHFNVLLHEDDKREIRLSGTIDLVDENIGLADWKTSGRGAYEKWEYERWAVQPTVYTYAEYAESGKEGPFPFTYFVMHKKGLQQFTVWRDASDWAWLRQQAVGYARLIEAGIPEWPLADNHALCSAKWCPAWYLCKGKHYDTI